MNLVLIGLIYLLVGSSVSAVVFHYTLYVFDFVYRTHRALMGRGVTLDVDTMSVIASILLWPAYLVGGLRNWSEGRGLKRYLDER